MFSRFLAFLQQIVAADKAPLIAADIAGLTLLAAKFGLHLNASVTAYLGVLLTALAGAFTHIHFAAYPKSELHVHFHDDETATTPGH